MTKTRNIEKYEYEAFNDGTCQSMETGSNTVKCCGYQRGSILPPIINLLCVLTGGVLYLLLRWYPKYKALLYYNKSQLYEADTILVKNKGGFITLCSVTEQPVKHFEYQHEKFVWSEASKSFVLLLGKTGTLAELAKTSCGLSPEQRELCLQIYGRNSMSIEVKSYGKLLVDEVLNPFYLFEVLSVILWVFDEYYHYAICVVILSGYAIISALYQSRKQSSMLKDMVKAVEMDYVTVCDDRGRSLLIPSTDVVPGDIIIVPPQGCMMPCDSLLLTGTCIVNEAVLTGESTPVTKVPALLVEEDYDPISVHAKNTLYGGTQIIQTRYYNHDRVTAVVVRTGSMTAKGQLVRSILYPKACGFDFYREAIILVVALFCVAAIGVLYSVKIFVERGSSLMTILLRSLDVMTIIVPPALPAAVTVGTMSSKSRLKKVGIYCTASERINVAGKVKLVCFDKTGTLTEEGLTVWGVLTVTGRSLVNIEEKPQSLPIMSPVLHAMASCHSLTKIDGVLCGDPLELSMFESTEWDLEESGAETNRFDQLAPVVVKPTGHRFVNSVETASPATPLDMKVPLEIGIVRQFHFNSNVQCMSVIARTLGARNMVVYTKGAPEKVLGMCNPDTVPENSLITLSYYTSAGYRVIALAYKKLPYKFNWLQSQKVSRDQIEVDLEFLGLLIMKNTLKEQSAPVIHELQQARIKCLMLTGDNMLTAVSVSRNCGLIAPSVPLAQVKVSTTLPRTVKLLPLNSSTDHIETDASSALAIDGPTWDDLVEYFPGLVPQVATRSVVFARMSPQQKANVVEALQSLDYIVMMVGDGANDCGALKTAHIGISISSAEASIAAPFTSAIQDVTCVPKLITEGRCALVTNFGLFNFMVLVGLVQFSSVFILYLEGLEMGTFQFLYVDLVVTSSLALVMGWNKPGERIVPKRPISRLLSPSNMIPLVLQIIVCVLSQVSVLELVKCEPWYVHAKRAKGDDYVVSGWENSAVFILSCYQYVILAVTFSKGKPHRRPIYRNRWFMITVLSLVGWTTLLLIAPFDGLSRFFDLKDFYRNDTVRFRLLLVALVTVNLILSLLIEHTVAQSYWFKRSINIIRRKKVFRNKYKIVETRILSSRAMWDPMSV
uniref:Cation-transporting ATPase n=3 Tax=Lygus hesperus TaxID=30085 RepID=A0A0A9WMI9_LYGHE